MKNSLTILLLSTCLACTSSDHNNNENPITMKPEETFGYDYDFLKKYKEVVLLEQGGMRVAIVGDYQARVMTSSAKGLEGFSYGWINHELISLGKNVPHINPFGGEERFWFGPEGGQYSIFFAKGSPFEFAHWQTPAEIDTVSYELLEKQADKAVFSKDMELTNYSGTKFKVNLNREISLINESQLEKLLGVSAKDVAWVGYQTRNVVKNTGNEDWDKSKGVLSIWLLGMMKASAGNTVIIPYQTGQDDTINDSYFGKIPADRLVKKDGVLFFKADAKARGKIGIPPQALKPIAGSYDAERRILTIIQFDYNGETDYVNSMWEIQKEPFKGDVINAYNDGKNDLGYQMGQFYELESSSPAIALKKNETLTHTQRTFHFEGTETSLDAICHKLLGVRLADIPQL